MQKTIINIGGEAGFGIMSAGLTLTKLATRSGYGAFCYSEYPSIIRGGYNVVQVAVGQKTVRAPEPQTNILVALNREAIVHHAPEFTPDTLVLYDAEDTRAKDALPRHTLAIAVPFGRIAKDVGGTIMYRNTAALGALTAATGASLATLQKLLAEEFGAKKKDVAEKNKLVAAAGYDFVKKNFSRRCRAVLVPLKKKAKKIVLTGNEAVAYGAIAAGLQFAAVYPMTPTSNILHTLAPHQTEYGYVYKQPEDEISAINMAIGAGFAGARAMVATAGGGYCLMTEGYGLAAMTETPVVIVVGMRGGPATGLPTWTEQADLRFVLHAHQGDFPRIVLAPGDVDEAFHQTMQAFNLAEKYQTPVIVLVDKHLCESTAVTEPFSYDAYKIERGPIVKTHQLGYERYAITKNGVSPRSFPGVGNHILANSDEHNSAGYSDETAENRVAMMEKRMAKFTTCAATDLPDPDVYGPAVAHLTIVSWGSNKGAILDALEDLPGVNFLHLTWLSPFPTSFVKKFLARANHIVILECNFTGQLRGLIREHTGIDIENTINKYDGRPFFASEIVSAVKKFFRSL